MTQDIFRLVYHSETAITGPAEIVDAEIHRILEASRRNNSRETACQEAELAGASADLPAISAFVPRHRA